jgi:hypothetical protein
LVSNRVQSGTRIKYQRSKGKIAVFALRTTTSNNIAEGDTTDLIFAF